MCKESLDTDRAGSNGDNEDPVFDLFSTEVFDPSDESIEQITALSEIVGDEDSVSA